MNELCEKLDQLRAHADSWDSSNASDQAEREALMRLATRLRDLIADIEARVTSIRLRYRREAIERSRTVQPADPKDVASVVGILE
jgi:hypothetical protein